MARNLISNRNIINDKPAYAGYGQVCVLSRWNTIHGRTVA